MSACCHLTKVRLLIIIINRKIIIDNDIIVVDNNQAPEVSGISPSEGSIEGNERVILRGSNLGDSKDDVVRVTIVNIDCTNSMEYYSSGDCQQIVSSVC